LSPKTPDWAGFLAQEHGFSGKIGADYSGQRPNCNAALVRPSLPGSRMLAAFTAAR
jgi:hypothetical protein